MNQEETITMDKFCFDCLVSNSKWVKSYAKTIKDVFEEDKNVGLDEDLILNLVERIETAGNILCDYLKGASKTEAPETESPQ